MATFQLHPDDARLVYLAAVYHLGRPGSETDAATLQRHTLGLGPVRDALEPRLAGEADGRAVIELELSAYQLTRLGAALLGTVNELKQYGMADGRSAVPGFAAALGRFYPDLGRDGSAALDLVPHAVMLHRRFDAAVRDAEEQVAAARSADHRAPRTREDSWWRLRGRFERLVAAIRR